MCSAPRWSRAASRLPTCSSSRPAKWPVEPAACLVIEDSAPGIRAARAAGMTAIGFTGGSHCGAGHDARLREAGAELICADARALGVLLRDVLSR
jgi:beta-phosphoglucomutase-like phosphatase (HAD superfamily)